MDDHHINMLDTAQQLVDRTQESHRIAIHHRTAVLEEIHSAGALARAIVGVMGWHPFAVYINKSKAGRDGGLAEAVGDR